MSYCDDTLCTSTSPNPTILEHVTNKEENDDEPSQDSSSSEDDSSSSEDDSSSSEDDSSSSEDDSSSSEEDSYKCSCCDSETSEDDRCDCSWCESDSEKYYHLYKRPCLGLPTNLPEDRTGFPQWLQQQPLSVPEVDTHLPRSISGGFTIETETSGIRGALDDSELNFQFGIPENPFTDMY
jgi:hypothetical protein